MAISIDWPSGVISIPKDDLTLVQSSPFEVRELDLNSFRLELKSLEDDPAGMGFPKTHNHNTEVSLGGITYARVIEILPPYTITFEDGQYAVNLVGANSNVGDRLNLNQVSVRSNNSAGLINNPAIEFSSYNGGVAIDVNSPYDGTLFPVGTEQKRVNNFEDAKLIADYRGFDKYYIHCDPVIDYPANIENKTLIGESIDKTHITVLSGALTAGAEIQNASISGVLDNGLLLKNVGISDLEFLDGMVFDSILTSGTIYLGSGSAHFLNCSSGVAGDGTPIIDCGGYGSTLHLRNYNGGLKLVNKLGPEQASIDLNSGQIQVDLNTVTNGKIVVRGVGKLIDANTGTYISTGTYGNLEIINETVTPEAVAYKVWKESSSSYSQPGSFGHIVGKIMATCQAGTLTTTQFSTDRTEPDGFWTDKLFLQFTGNVTSSLANKTCKIQSYVQTNGIFTVDDQLPTAPAEGDTFYIINE
jgi:hypothetical protein